MASLVHNKVYSQNLGYIVLCCILYEIISVLLELRFYGGYKNIIQFTGWHCRISVALFFLTKHHLILEVESIKNTKRIICGSLSCYCSVFTLGFLFEKCNFKVHLVCEINCLGGKHITCWLTLNAENIQQHRMPSKFLILHGIKHLCKFICNNYLTTDYRGPLKQKSSSF